MLRTEQPIGIFDSGIGGLTVAKAIHKQLPDETLIYFGDTAHTPWGNQSANAIQHYATKISQTLLDQNCKIIVIACNTASAAAFEQVKDLVGDKALLFNVIDPVIDHLVEKHQNQTIGLIGTKQTIKSQAYKTRLEARSPGIILNSLATPLLAPLIEEGFSNSDTAQEVIDHYLTNPILDDISALILGCTHYPLIKQQVSKFFGSKVEVLDSAQLIANVIAKELDNQGLRNNSGHSSKTFYVSHDSEFFNHTAQKFFPGDIKLQTYPLWD
jgi:glutamate racemase